MFATWVINFLIQCYALLLLRLLLLHCCHVMTVQAWEEVKSGSGHASEAGMQLADISNYLLSKGLAHLPKPSWWLNGMLNAIPDGGASAVDQELAYAIMGEMQLLQEHIYFGRIDGEEPVRL
jgi:hypothetical protein